MKDPYRDTVLVFSGIVGGVATVFALISGLASRNAFRSADKRLRDYNDCLDDMDREVARRVACERNAEILRNYVDDLERELAEATSMT